MDEISVCIGRRNVRSRRCHLGITAERTGDKRDGYVSRPLPQSRARPGCGTREGAHSPRQDECDARSFRGAPPSGRRRLGLRRRPAPRREGGSGCHALSTGGRCASLIAWHNDTFVSGPAWGEFTKQMASAGANAIYVVGVQRAVAGHRDQLLASLSAPSGSKVESGNVLLQHVEGGDWNFLTLTRYNSWQDIGNDRGAPASAASPGGWADIREHSAFHRDTIADRIFPVK